MAAYKKTGIDAKSLLPGGGPYGNLTVFEFNMTTTSAGIVSNSDAAAAFGSGDTVKLGILPAGFRPIECTAVVSNAFTASSTADIGFLYVDGVDDTPAQDADYFLNDIALNATGVTRLNNIVGPVKFPKDVYVVLTHSAHTQAEAGVLDVAIVGVCKGAP